MQAQEKIDIYYNKNRILSFRKDMTSVNMSKALYELFVVSYLY